MRATNYNGKEYLPQYPDIHIGMATIKAIGPNVWALPGYRTTTSRGEAVAEAKRMNHYLLSRANRAAA